MENGGETFESSHTAWFARGILLSVLKIKPRTPDDCQKLVFTVVVFVQDSFFLLFFFIISSGLILQLTENKI